jgi:hypothetical protein
VERAHSPQLGAQHLSLVVDSNQTIHFHQSALIQDVAPKQEEPIYITFHWSSSNVFKRGQIVIIVAERSGMKVEGV